MAVKIPQIHGLFQKIKVRRADMERLLIVCAAVMVVVLALRDTRGSQLEMVYEEQLTTAAQTSADPADTQVSSGVPMQSTVVWYEDGDGYLVPVTRQIPQQEGVAKATLALMVQSSENDLAAARMGLKTVIPEGTTFDLDISGGKARVDMSAEALNCSSAEEELLMVQATAAALCGFDSVEEVSFLFGGQKRSQLTYGTDVSGVFSADSVNVESLATMADSTYADQVQLYFPSASGRLLVPVTRTVFSPADLPTAILELVKGPKADSGLETPVPGDCGVKSVKVKDGVATIDFTSEFAAIGQQDDGGLQAIRAVLFTASQFPGVKEVQILVEGQPYQSEPAAATTFVNAAEEVIAQYPGVIEID